MTRFEVQPLAVLDIDSIAQFYSLVENGVEERWITAVEKLTAEIVRRPLFGSSTYAERLNVEGLRHRQVPRFPYIVFYVMRENSIVIARVLHERRDVVAELED